MLEMARLDLISEIENAITARLEPIKALGSFVQAQPEQMGRPMPVSQLFVAYRGSNWEDGHIEQHVRLDRLMQFQVTWRLRDLQSHQAVHRIEQGTLHLLVGWRPLVCDRGLFPIKSDYLGQDEQNFWVCNLMFGLVIDTEQMDS